MVTNLIEGPWLEQQPEQPERNNQPPVEAVALREACAHVLGTGGARPTLMIHDVGQALLAWALGAGGVRRELPPDIYFPAGTWYVLVEVLGVTCYLYPPIPTPPPGPRAA